MRITICNPTIEKREDDEFEEYTADQALEDAQEEAQKGLKALERVHFHLDGNASDAAYDSLEDIYKALTRMTWL